MKSTKLPAYYLNGTLKIKETSDMTSNERLFCRMFNSGFELKKIQNYIGIGEEEMKEIIDKTGIRDI
jgi:hypothetical protein